MKLVLAAALPLAALPLIADALGKVNVFQSWFGSGGQYNAVGKYINGLLGLNTDAAEQTRLNATVNEVRNNFNRTFSSITGVDLFSPFTPEKSIWLQNQINSEINIAVNRLNTARAANNAGEMRVFARYIKAFEILTAENKQRLIDARAQIPGGNAPQNEQLQKIGVGAAVAGLALKLAGVI